MSDTPTHRATINQMSVDQLDEMLTAIRERRLERVHKLEAIARARDVQLVSWLALSVICSQAALDRLAEQEAKVEALIHRCGSAMVVNSKWGADDAAD
jgi:hypothetical protein